MEPQPHNDNTIGFGYCMYTLAVFIKKIKSFKIVVLYLVIFIVAHTLKLFCRVLLYGSTVRVGPPNPFQKV